MTASSPLRSAASTASARRRLMVVESGASVFTREGAEQFDETVAIAQLQGERPGEFAERCLHRIASAERAGRGFRAAMLFTSARHDQASADARRLIALGIAQHAESAAELSELVVVTAPTAEPQLRDELLDLVDELLLCSDRRPLPVRICFTERQDQPEQDSGVFWTLADADRHAPH